MYGTYNLNLNRSKNSRKRGTAQEHTIRHCDWHGALRFDEQHEQPRDSSEVQARGIYQELGI